MKEYDEGFNGTLTPGRRPAVLAIDLMRAYFDDASPLCLPSKECLSIAANVIEAARLNACPVIHARVQYGPEGKDGGLFVKKVPALKMLIGETTMSEIMPDVKPSPDEVTIVKQYASAFFGTSLSSTLLSQGVDTVIILGVSTSGCVRATALDAMQHGFTPIVVSDAVGDREERVHQASLYDLQAKYAEVVKSLTAIDYLSRCSASDAASESTVR